MVFKKYLYFIKFAYIFYYILFCSFYCIINCQNKITKLNKNIDNWTSPILETFHFASYKSYYPLSFKKSIIRALDAFINKDEHSRFLSSKEYNELTKETHGTFYGVGVILAPKKFDDDFLLVLNTVNSSPAEKSGVKRYDKIISVNNKLISDLTMDEAVELLKSPKRYSEVSINILREPKKLLTINLKRDKIKEQNTKCYYFTKTNVAYISISMFTHKSYKDILNILTKVQDKKLYKKLSGIIIDLRDNIGGILDSAIKCASAFVDKNRLVITTRDRKNMIIKKFYTSKNKILKSNIPIFILVNGFTASSAEILAGSLRFNSINNYNNPYIFLLGTQTFGKGSVQEIIPISNNCALKITTCLYCLPDGKPIDKVGIAPDFLVKQKYPPTKELKLVHKLFKEQPNKSSNYKKQNLNLNFDFNKNKNIDKNIEIIKNDYQIQTTINFISLLDLAIKNFPKAINNHNKAFNFLNKYYISQNTNNILKIL